MPGRERDPAGLPVFVTFEGGALVADVTARPGMFRLAPANADSSVGWDVEVPTGPAGEDPLVRQRPADHPEWVGGLGFVSFRITSEIGGAPFAAYRVRHEKRFGAEPVGVGNVVQPPDWTTYPHDAVRRVEAAVRRAGPPPQRAVLGALQQVSITGANGDERGFGPDGREGVTPDDMYVTGCRGMRFVPARDAALSTHLPTVPQ